jgi:hypothetical protein
VFSSREELLHHVFCVLEQQKLEEMRSATNGTTTLAAQLKNALRQRLIHDLKHAQAVRLMHSFRWMRKTSQDRELCRLMQSVRDLIIAYFDEAAAQGQIDAGNYRAASSLLLAAYLENLREAVLENSDADRAILLIEPQIAIILRGFGFRSVPGLKGD